MYNTVYTYIYIILEYANTSKGALSHWHATLLGQSRSKTKTTLLILHHSIWSSTIRAAKKEPKLVEDCQIREGTSTNSRNPG